MHSSVAQRRVKQIIRISLTRSGSLAVRKLASALSAATSPLERLDSHFHSRPKTG